MKQKGFTIVELLIVIVIIGILAAITVVAFNGVQNRGNDASVQADLKNIGNLLEQYKITNGEYPSSLSGLPGIRISKGAYGAHFFNGTGDHNLLYCRDRYDPTATFALIAGSKSGTVFQFSMSGGLKPHGYALNSNTTTCPRAGVAITLPDYAVMWGYANGTWNSSL